MEASKRKPRISPGGRVGRRGPDGRARLARFFARGRFEILGLAALPAPHPPPCRGPLPGRTVHSSPTPGRIRKEPRRALVLNVLALSFLRPHRVRRFAQPLS
ncbi:uncharacterized protein VTP21DRAFT_10143 [Calcarisporiella thermophila]|uniref:uncharacterized protein n=1 Tax=Calcarisporiella thermophila TaxID=911321 RepID=UPI003744840E